MSPIGVRIRKKTIARMIRVDTYDSTAANAIHTRLGRTKSRGQTTPRTNKRLPNVKRTCATLSNRPRYNHHPDNKIRMPPTIKPNSLSARKERLFIPKIEVIRLLRLLREPPTFPVGRQSNGTCVPVLLPTKLRAPSPELHAAEYCRCSDL